MIKIINGNGDEVKYKHLKFPGGELHVTIVDVDKVKDSNIIIQARITDPIQEKLLWLITDALKTLKPNDIALDLPYLPYARQDRLANKGESFSLKVFCNQLNYQDYASVSILDCHSDVGISLIDEIISKTNHELVLKSIQSLGVSISTKDMVLVAPDGGALKKIYKLQEFLRQSSIELPIAEGQKKRDTITGAISGFDIHYPWNSMTLEKKHLIIVDDICDGGGTFLGLASRIKEEAGTATVNLIVSHGIFSQGFDKLLSVLDKIYTTDSFQSLESISEISGYDPERVKVINYFD